MANEKKSIIEEALLEASQIDATFKSNAKEILAHTMGSEIEEMVKESLTGSKKKRNLKEEDELDLDLELDSDDEVEGEGDELDLDLDTEEGDGDESIEGLEGEGDDLDLELGNEDEDLDDTDDIDLDLGGLGNEDEEGDTDLSGLGLGLGDEDNTDLDLGLGGEGDETDVETMDLTGASDSDVISVFKKMGPEDEIEVVNNNGMVTLKDNKSGSEYRIELNTGGLGQGIGSVETSEIEPELELGEGTDNDENLEEGVIYEIIVEDDSEEEVEEEVIEEDEDNMSYMNGPLENEEEETTTPPKGPWEGHFENKPSKGKRDYMSRTLPYEGRGNEANHANHRPNGQGRERAGSYDNVTESKVIKLRKENTNLNTKNLTLENANKELTENHDKMVGALKQFRTKLQEVAVFNSNLAYAVRLFTENSTTKDEKQEILKRLDSAKSIKESQSIYKQLMKEYSSAKAPIKESIDEKINKTASSGSSQISEQSVFVHPELQNMKKLWEYGYKK
jgi:hypothetical protein